LKLPLNDQNDPNKTSTLGIWSGTYLDDSDVYAGTGNFSDCDGVDPARITISENDRGKGAYMGEYFFYKNC
jgi:hypothetical protein